MEKGVVRCTVDMHGISQRISRHIDKIRLHIIRQLTYIGEQCVTIARQRGSYNDITGNLRSSIGYMILQDGEPVSQGRSQRYSGEKGGGDEGVQAAQALLDQLRGKFPKGIVLIVCAGMRYASYVEDIHHKDVLASAEQTARSLVRELLAGIITE